MNERIKELERQADEYADGLGLAGDEWCDAQSTKFAELIVRECLFIIDDERKPDMVNRTELWHQIVEHFGFKE